MSAAPTLPDARAASAAAPAAVFPVAALVRQLRPRHWVKNFACLAGLIFSGQLLAPEAVGRAGLGFVVFCAVASAVYIVNDFIDRGRDRLNPRTAHRPLASGALPVWLALAVAAVLALAASAGAALLGTPCLALAGLYAALNVFYSLKAKRTVIADVFCIALGFVLRVLFGAFAVAAPPTAWIVLCMFFLALFLGFGKRRAELSALGDDSSRARAVLGKYRVEYLDLLLGVTAALTVLSYALFTVAAHRNPTLVVTVVPVVYCVFRYLLLVVVHRLGESPEEVLLGDRMLWVGIAAWVALCVAVLYGGLHLFVEQPPFPHG
jgi:4-hydroxybenzoate polyprenyltransferase